ncbi:cell cycle checkpoint protein RAD17 [Ophiocordyceps camponoti-floridani]|uniref:Cell cycle checkpoint protein RAD17 n=1 Tax=Ophiocordyceps camponoti-floridani TaxID=2030778 RepID=A0A8H4Q0Y0_9HYPO|nr:cell cycle checkpoint protein RAD17 [Ophiocordyceps camponoti-floridani]
MAPPAKRRRRNPVEDSDGEAEQPRATLANYLISSPTRKEPSSPSKNVTAQKRPRRVATQSNGVGLSPKKAAGNGRSDEKPKTADLKTLFSKQVQRTTRSKTSANTNTPMNDIISDPISEEDEISDLKASSSSLVGQHARKRLKNGSGAGAVQVPSASRRFLKPTKPATVASVDDDDLRPWSERFGPRNLDELAVHKRKVSDVRRWLEAVTAGRIRQRLLVLKGAAGSGKTTTVRLLAQDMGLELLEWKNPTGSRDMLSPSASAQFDEFLGRGGKFGMLDVEAPGTSSSSGVAAQDQSKRIMLVEEFPNTFSRTSSTLASFRRSIIGYLDAAARPKSQAVNPMIVVISETLLTTTSATADSLTAHRLLGPEILRHPGAVVMEFNAIAPTFLAKAMELIVQKEARKSGRRKTPGPMVLNRLGEIGDIRSAISALEFLCLKGDYEADWGAKVAFTKQKKGVRTAIGLTQGEAETLEAITQREASLGIFHAVGKVVYNKRDEAPPADDNVETLPAFIADFARPNRSQVPVDSLIDEIGTDTQTFVSALHENYILSCESTEPMDTSTSMDYVNECIEYLSLSDLLGPSRDVFFGGFGRDSSSSQQLRQDEMTFQVAVRGLLFSLPHPVKRKPTGTLKGSDAFKMFYPTSIKLWKSKEEIEGLVDVWSSRLLRGEEQLGSKNSTDGANAFRKPTTTSWTDRAQREAAAANSEVSEARPPMWLGSTARREMVQDRLPYMAHMARARRSGTRDLEKMVAMRGTWKPTDEDGDGGGDQELDGSAGEAWATDRPSEEASPQRRRAGVRAGEVSGLMTQKLVLSDDDIEDD